MFHGEIHAVKLLGVLMLASKQRRQISDSCKNNVKFCLLFTTFDLFEEALWHTLPSFSLFIIIIFSFEIIYQLWRH